jgi:hypothetical protein
MPTTLNPAHGDPCDVLEIAPDIVLVARAEEELSKLARDAKARGPQPSQPKPDATFKDPSVPPIDTAFRATVNRAGSSGGGVRSIRRFVGVLVAICLGVAVLTLKVSGDVAQQVITAWLPQFAGKTEAPDSAAPQEPSAVAAQQAATVQQAAATATAPPPVQPIDTTTQSGVATGGPARSADQAQMMQSMAHHLETFGKEIEELKGQLAELRANQEQMSRDMAKATDQKLKLSALPPRPAAPPRRPPPMIRPAQAAAAPVAPPPAQAYVPPPPGAPYSPPPGASTYAPPPQAAPQAAYDPNAPRPPLPVRE